MLRRTLPPQIQQQLCHWPPAEGAGLTSLVLPPLLPHAQRKKKKKKKQASTKREAFRFQ